MPAQPSKPKAATTSDPATTVVVLVRHGKAQRHAESGRDEDRRLKPRGERQAAWLGKELTKLGLAPQTLYHSPVHRAVQTANRMKPGLKCELKEADALALGTHPKAAIDLIKKRLAAGDRVVMLVGHNPQLEEVAALMVAQLRKNGVDLCTGEALVIEVHSPDEITKAKLTHRLRLEDDEDD